MSQSVDPTAALKALEDALRKARRGRPREIGQASKEAISRVAGSGVAALSRLLLACLAAKVANPRVKATMPYTAIDDPGSFSGRTVDEGPVEKFRTAHALPLNSTTAFLTPALRNRNSPFAKGQELEGKDRDGYRAAVDVLTAVDARRQSAADSLQELLWHLLQKKADREAGLRQALKGLKDAREAAASTPSVDALCHAVRFMLDTRGSSRVPVILLHSAWSAAATVTDFAVSPLTHHNAADSQTRSLGDVVVSLSGWNYRVAYEVKDRPVVAADIEVALEKIARLNDPALQQYVFFGTARAAGEVAREQLAPLCSETGIDFLQLDCLEFIRHFLSIFHMAREPFIEVFQRSLEAEPSSAIPDTVKIAVLAILQEAVGRELGAP